MATRLWTLRPDPPADVEAPSVMPRHSPQPDLDLPSGERLGELIGRLDASRSAQTYCMVNGSQVAVSNIGTNPDGSRTVMFQCTPR